MSWDITKIPVVCINLDRKPERWERLQSQAGFSEFPAGIQRWSAKDAKTIDVNSDKNISLTVRRNIEKRRRRAHEDIGNVGAIGCYYSHLSVAEWFLRQNAPVVLVLEDDIKMSTGTFRKLKEHVANTPLLQDSSKWDIWNLGAWSWDYTSIDEYNRKINAFYLNHAYLMTKSGARVLVDNAFPIIIQYDGYMSLLAQLSMLRLFGSKKYLITQWGDQKSDTQGDRTCHICDLPDNWQPSNGGKNTEGFVAPYSTERRLAPIPTILIAVALVGGAWTTWRLTRSK